MSTPRTRLPSQNRRQQILEAAETLFVARGFEAVGMADLAETAGVSRPTIYSYFPNTEAILDELLNVRLQAFWTRLSPLLVPGMTPQPQSFAALFRFLLSERATLSLLHSGGGPGFQARRMTVIQELGRRVQAQRLPNLDRAPALRPIVITSLEALAWDSLQESEADQRAMTQALDTFMRGGVSALLAEP